MNTSTSKLRTLTAIGAGLALTLAACGGDDDAEPAPAPAEEPAEEPASEPTAEPAGEPADAGDAEVATAPAAIAFDAQDSDGTTITVASIDLPSPGFIAVHSDGGGSPGPVIGVSDLLPAGTSTDVSVTLDTPLDGDTTLFPMVHIDTNSNGIYEFGAVEGVDGPGVTDGGDVAVVGGAVTVATGSDEGAAGETAAITIAEFAFGGVSEVAVGTTVIVTNDDASPHTWTSVDDVFDSGALAQGESFEFTFTEPGEFQYFCNIHPSMTGTITVTG